MNSSMNNIFFSSDHHYFHKNIQKFCPHSRKGADILEMNELMIVAHNSRVQPKDTVYSLGDFSFGTAEQTLEILDRLNGNIHLVLGNHDKVIRGNRTIQSKFRSVQEYLALSIGRQKIVMCHFPFAVFDSCHYGAYHLHGHSHGSYTAPGRIMDVGIDTRPAGDMTPWSWEEIDAILKTVEYTRHH